MSKPLTTQEQLMEFRRESMEHKELIELLLERCELLTRLALRLNETVEVLTLIRSER